MGTEAGAEGPGKGQGLGLVGEMREGRRPRGQSKRALAGLSVRQRGRARKEWVSL